MAIQLTDLEVRVLGSLIEKDITTPDYYPLSLNALVNACNQKNNRDPVMTLGEDAVRQGLSGLQEKRLAGPAGGADSRVPKYEHRLQEVFNFDRREIAVLCVLLLRGPQTPGELRSRTDRMHHFEALDEVQATLQRLIEREEPLVMMLPRQPGTKEARYDHLLSDHPRTAHSSTDGDSSIQPGSSSNSPDRGRLSQLEHEVSELRREVGELREQLAEFRKVFE
ncbi:MAG: YceH family protein [Terriglobales bacterium]